MPKHPPAPRMPPAADPAPPAAPEGRRVVIPEDVARRIEARIRTSGFGTLDAFVSYVLARLLENPDPVPFSEEEERRLRDQLRSLGYID